MLIVFTVEDVSVRKLKVAGVALLTRDLCYCCSRLQEQARGSRPLPGAEWLADPC